MILPEKPEGCVVLEESPSKGPAPWVQVLPIGEHMSKYMKLLEEHNIKFYKLSSFKPEDIQYFTEKYCSGDFMTTVAATYGGCKNPLLFAVDENLGAVVAAIGDNGADRIYKPIVYQVYRFYHLATVLLNLILYEGDYASAEVRDLYPLIDGATLSMHSREVCQSEYDSRYKLYYYVLERGIGWTDC